MTRIDTHLHLWDPALGVYDWLTPDLGPLHARFTPEQAQQELVSSGVDGAILVQAADSTLDTDAMMAAAAEHPWIVGVVGWIDLEQPDDTDTALTALTEAGPLVGVRQLVHDDPRAGFYSLPAVRASAERLAAHGIPLDIPDAFPRDLTAATELATAVPGLTVVLDHLGKPPAQPDAYAVWSAQVREFASRANTVAKISGLWRADTTWGVDAVAPAIDLALECFGVDRLMIGSDWPITIAGPGYADTMTVLETALAGLSVTELDALWRRTPTRVYALQGGDA